MKKRGARIKHTRCTSPMVVATYLSPEVAGRDRVAVMAIQQGWATAEHLNILLETQQMLIFGGERTKDDEALKVGQFAQIAIANIRDRMKEKNRIGATGEELKALRLMVDYSESFWQRKSGAAFTDAYRAVDRFWQMNREAA